MNIRKNYRTHAIIFGTVMVLAFAFNWVEPDKNILIVGVVAFIWFAYVMLRYHRCPRCRKYLPLLDFKSTNCRYCGASLDEKEHDHLICPNCGKSNKRFDTNSRQIRYCGYCGCSLDD